MIDADRFVERLAQLIERTGDRVALVTGSGVTTGALPGVTGMLDLADEYVENRPDRVNLAGALRRAREETPDDPIRTYLAYRRAFAIWVSGDEYDVVAQEAVLRAYGGPVPNHGRWQRVDAVLGERLENDLCGWRVPVGVAALGRLLASRPQRFTSRIMTTNFDPLLEVAIRRAGHAATTIAFHPDDPDPLHEPPDASIRVHHLHGYWRPEPGSRQRRLLYDPAATAERRTVIAARVARLIRADVVCVIGHSGWDETVVNALRMVGLARPRLRVLWATRRVDDEAARQLREWAADRTGATVEVFTGVDGDLALPRLAERLGATAPTRASTVRPALRHPAWERELISEPGAGAPDDCLALLRQLDRRFQWERSWWEHPVPPRLLFWPVRLRRRPSAIHMAQAFVAAAISARGARVVLCLDDYGVEDVAASTERLGRNVRRWFAHVPGSTEPGIVSLQDVITRADDDAVLSPAVGGTVGASEMRRPTHPWAVAREVYGERNLSLRSVLVAVKVLPDIPADQMIEHASSIMQALERHSASRLLTPLTVFACLNQLLLERPTDSVLALGGRDEWRLWELWREVFDYGVNQLYSPGTAHLTSQSLALQWSSRRQLRGYLDQAMELDGWDGEGRYLPWLARNGFLLPAYLAGTPLPKVGRFRLDSWPGIREALVADRSVLDVLAAGVSDLYLEP